MIKQKLCINNEFVSNFNISNITILKDKNSEIINIDNTIYKTKIKNSGSYGDVYIMKSNNDMIAIKIFDDIADYLKEKIISIILSNIRRKNNCSLPIVSSYWYEKKNNNLIIMECMDGNLNELIKNNPSCKIYDIFLQVIEAVYELYNYGIYYCDIKLANILYKLINNNIKIKLADIGGIVFTNNNKLHDLLNTQDLEKSILLINNPDSTLNFNMEINNKYYKVGNVILDDKSLYNKEIKIQCIKENQAKVHVNWKKYILHSLYVHFDEYIFTFPHYLNPDGIVHFKNTDSDNFKRNIIMNNIFQSLGVLFIQLLFGDFYNLNNDMININFDKSINKIKEMIEISEYDILDKKLISEILFGNSTTYGLVSKTYNDYSTNDNVKNMFFNIINKIKEIGTN